MIEQRSQEREVSCHWFRIEEGRGLGGKSSHLQGRISESAHPEGLTVVLGEGTGKVFHHHFPGVSEGSGPLGRPGRDCPEQTY